MVDNQTVQISEFGGLNTNTPPENLQDGEFQVLQNAVFRRGTWQKRRGATDFMDLSSESPTLHNVGFLRDDAFGFINLYWFDSTNHTLYTADVSVTDLGDLVVLSTDVKKILSNVLGTSAGGYVVIQQQSDDSIQLARLRPLLGGSEFEIVTSNLEQGVSGPNHCWLWEHKDRLWVLNNNIIIGDYFEGSVIGYSEPGDYTTLDTTSTSPRLIQIQNARCIEAQIFTDKILLFSVYGGIWHLITQGSPRNWSLNNIDFHTSIPICRRLGDTGSADTRFGYQQATLKHKGVVYYLAIDGLYVTDGVDTEKLSFPIDNYINITLTPRGTVGGNVATEYSGICLFDEINNDLLIKVTYSSTNSPKYFIYNINSKVWSEFIYGESCPINAPVKSSPFSDIIVDYQTYPYTFESMQYIYLEEGGQNIPGGIYLFSNAQLIEKNRIVRIRSTDRTESDYAYSDSTDIPFVTKFKTKNFDFGYKGINKKNPKIYLSLRYVLSSFNLGSGTDIKIIRYVNDNPLSDIDLTIDSTHKHLKFSGPGYFIEEVLEISDENDNNCNFWELVSFGFDLYNKAEQSQTIGNN